MSQVEVATKTMVRVENVHRWYGGGAAVVPVLRGVSFDVPRGELVALTGRPGSGRTTLLNLVGGLDEPDAGRITVDGLALEGLGEDGLLELRRDRIGFVFQPLGLIPLLTVAENVGVPLRLRGIAEHVREERIARLLSLVGLTDDAARRPGELTGGQQQRVAIARALAGDPVLLVADDFAAGLDAGTGRALMELLHTLVRGEQVTALVAPSRAIPLDPADRVLELCEGGIVEH
ncbi:ABC transporter ATP-binding protein [Streptomyces sp. NBC_00271]|uniref:ABC transporter ATP-binding protein n=1 Tax=Streptomyces sp. NBC_00271 TaxID=2975697 RepID=UPI002E2BDE40|nr:ABC transporter ATP-binding protein [Streptomyces sp. NBC_00271]